MGGCFDVAMPWTQESDPYSAEIRAELGRALRELRQLQGLSQKGLEDRSGLDQTIISRLERGRDVKLRLTRLLILLRALGVARIELESRHEGASIAAFMRRHERGRPTDAP
jgi:transcriptional regulator with XRE-family HTH domain